jgi:hypothetical protein
VPQLLVLPLFSPFGLTIESIKGISSKKLENIVPRIDNLRRYANAPSLHSQSTFISMTRNMAVHATSSVARKKKKPI